jgi:hypothetical protein
MQAGKSLQEHKDLGFEKIIETAVGPASYRVHSRAQMNIPLLVVIRGCGICELNYGIR